jgi:hypothetical protein
MPALLQRADDALLLVGIDLGEHGHGGLPRRTSASSHMVSISPPVRQAGSPMPGAVARDARSPAGYRR